MFDQLFARSDTVARYLSGPLVDERRHYLTHCAVQGMAKSALEAKARLLLSIAEYLRLADRPQRHDHAFRNQESGNPMVESQLAFATKLRCQAVAGLLHSNGG